MAIKNDVIDTGLVEFVLPFDRGEEKIFFNPNDIDFFIRLSDMVENIGNIYEKAFAEYEKTESRKEKLEVSRKLNEDIKECFDVGFGNKVSGVIFKYVSPNGFVKSKNQYYPYYILEWLIPKIEKETGKTPKAAMSALEKAMNKHASQYPHKFK